MPDAAPNAAVSNSDIHANDIDLAKIELERSRFELDRIRHRADILKWIVVAVGAVISFAVIDFGKLQLERFRATAENRRELLNSYLKATEAPEPDVWKR